MNIGGIKMENKIALIEKMKADFEAGLRPAMVAEKYKVTTHQSGALARLLGFVFTPWTRDPKEWYEMPKRERIGFGTVLLHEIKGKIKRYKVAKIDTKLKTIVIEYE